MVTFKAAIDNVLHKLNDDDAEVWTRAQIADFLLEGYEALCRQARCLFDMKMFTNAPLTGNYTKDFERDYMGDIPILAKFTYTKDSDREYMRAEAEGPANHTKPSDAAYMTETDKTPTTRRVGTLPESLVDVDRVTHDWLALRAEHPRYLRETSYEYEQTQGGVYAYSMGQDGLYNFRTVGVPSTVVPTVDIQGVRGVIRYIDEDDLDQEPIVGPSWGIIRQIPQHFASGMFGGLKSYVGDSQNTRVEFYRMGKSGNGEQNTFEVPDRAVTYIEWYAIARAYSIPGNGENKTLSDHFKQRFDTGVGRLKSRVASENQEHVLQMGFTRGGRRNPYLSRFPSEYGTVIRNRR